MNVEGDEIDWPREIWARERDQFDVIGAYVLSEFSTIPLYEGDTERDCEHHLYVDGDIHESAQKYYREMLAVERTRVVELEAQNARLKEALSDLNQCDEWGVFSMDEVKDRARAALSQDSDPNTAALAAG